MKPIYLIAALMLSACGSDDNANQADTNGTNVTETVAEPEAEGAGAAKATIGKMSESNGFVNVDVTVQPADETMTVMPAIATAMESVKADADRNKFVPTTGDERITITVKLKKADGTENDFGNLSIPLLPLMTAPKGDGIAILNLVDRAQPGSGPGFDAAKQWCGLDVHRQRAANFCSAVDKAA